MPNTDDVPVPAWTFEGLPGHRIISGAADGKRWYDVNQSSAATPNGFGQEQTVRAIWMADSNNTSARTAK